MKFCRMVDVDDVITCVHFGDDRLGGGGLVRRAGAKLCPNSIDFNRRPYNTSYTTVRVCDVTRDTVKVAH